MSNMAADVALGHSRAVSMTAAVGVCFTPEATALLRRCEMTLWAISRHACAARLRDTPDPSADDQIDRSKKVHLADIDAVVAKDGIGHRNVEKGVGDRHLQQVVLAADDLTGRPGELDLAKAATGQAQRRPDHFQSAGLAAPMPASELGAGR